MAIIALIIGIITFIQGPLALAGSYINIPFLAASGAAAFYTFPLNVVGLFLAVFAARKKEKRTIAIVGIILNSIGILCFIGIFVMWGLVGD